MPKVYIKDPLTGEFKDACSCQFKDPATGIFYSPQDKDIYIKNPDTGEFSKIDCTLVCGSSTAASGGAGFPEIYTFEVGDVSLSDRIVIEFDAANLPDKVVFTLKDGLGGATTGFGYSGNINEQGALNSELSPSQEDIVNYGYHTRELVAPRDFTDAQFEVLVFAPISNTGYFMRVHCEGLTVSKVTDVKIFSRGYVSGNRVTLDSVSPGNIAGNTTAGSTIPNVFNFTDVSRGIVDGEFVIKDLPVSTSSELNVWPNPIRWKVDGTLNFTLKSVTGFSEPFTVNVYSVDLLNLTSTDRAVSTLEYTQDFLAGISFSGELIDTGIIVETDKEYWIEIDYS